MSYRTMRLEIGDDHVARLTFTEADRGNPIDPAFCADLDAVSIVLAVNPSVRAVLIRAEGKAFSYGGDIALFNQSLDDLPAMILQMTASLHPAIARLQRMDAPMVGAVHGVCAGGMTALMAGCDVLIASAHARFVSAYGGIGFSSDAGSSVMLSRRMGPARARRFLIMNETLDAPGALATGLADEVVAAETLADRGEELAGRLAKGPTNAFGETRRLVLSALDQPLETQLELEAQALARVARGPDAIEGLRAFKEGRKPVFKGR